MNTEATFCNNRSIGLTNDRPISAASSSHSSHSSVGVGGGGSSSSSPTHFHRSSVPHHHRFGGSGGVGGGGGGGVGGSGEAGGGGSGSNSSSIGSPSINGSSTRGNHQQQQQHHHQQLAALERVSRAGSPPPPKTDAARQSGPESRVPGGETPAVPPAAEATRRWVPPSLRPQHGLTAEAQNDAVFRTVRGILNKLTPENFQKLSDDLLKIDLNSKVILNGVIHLLFEKALDEQKYSSMYAQLCKRLSIEAPNFEEPSAATATVAPHGVRTNGAKNNTFLTLLLNVCRDRFINRKSVDHYSNAGSGGPLGTGGVQSQQQNDVPLSDVDLEERILIAKHKMLGNVKFIGELAKLDMLTDERLHKCVQQLLDKSRASSAKDRCEDLECLSQLIRTCGKNLDTAKGKMLMDQYFLRMEKYTHSAKFPARIRFMLRDVIELRKRDWVPRKQTAEGPMPIDQLQPDDDGSGGHHGHSRSPFGSGGRHQGGGGRNNGGNGGGGHHGGGGGGGGHHSGGGHHHHHQSSHQHHGSAAGDQEQHGWMNKMGSMSLSGGGHHQGGHHGGDYGLSMTSSSHYSQPYNSSPGGGHYNNRDYRDGGSNRGGGSMDYRQNSQRNNYNNQGNYGNSYNNGTGNQINRFNNNGVLNKAGGAGYNSATNNGPLGGGGYQSQAANNSGGGGALNSKDLAPRFKRNLISASTAAAATDPADALTFRPAANSLLFKVNSINASQLPLQQQQRTSQGALIGGPVSNTGSPYTTGGAGNFTAGVSQYGNNNTASGGNQQQQPQDVRLNSNNPLLQANKLGSASSTLSDHHLQQQQQQQQQQYHSQHNSQLNQQPATAFSVISKLNPPQPINNLLKKDQILIKQASLEKPKQTKKDKGPVKEDVLKRVQFFVMEHFVNAEPVDIAAAAESSDISVETSASDESHQEKANADANESELTNKSDDDKDNDNSVVAQLIANGDSEHHHQTQLPISPEPESASLAAGLPQSAGAITAAFAKLGVPDKFMRDALTTVLDEIVDKPDHVHERCYQLLAALRSEGRLPTAAVLDGFRGLLKNDAIHPRIATQAAQLLCRAVSGQLLRIQDVAQLADGGQNYPLFLLVLQQLHRTMGKTALLQAYAASKVQLMGTLPEVDRSKERMAAILQDRGLSYLYPLLKLQGELQKQIEADANPAQLYKWIKDNVDATCYADPGFITALMNVLLKYVTQETTLAEGSDRTRMPEKSVVAREQAMLVRYCPVLQAFLRDQADLELVAVYVLQTFCYTNGWPKGMLLRWFTALYDLNVVAEESFLRWKEDLSDAWPGKGQALFQVNSYLQWLEQVDSEDEDEDDE